MPYSPITVTTTLGPVLTERDITNFENELGAARTRIRDGEIKDFGDAVDELGYANNKIEHLLNHCDFLTQKLKRKYSDVDRLTQVKLGLEGQVSLLLGEIKKLKESHEASVKAAEVPKPVSTDEGPKEESEKVNEDQGTSSAAKRRSSEMLATGIWRYRVSVMVVRRLGEVEALLRHFSLILNDSQMHIVMRPPF
ncbi:MAG: hypothetical protein M1816_000594 [Peltula sp. TS41687]|nr:MAG: hypothetical protein M1816_000594 [Peltula sp. TS41687]